MAWLLFLPFVLLAFAGMVFWIWALVDCLQVPDDSMYESGNKLVWVLVLVFLQIIGAILYVAIGRPKTRSSSHPQPPIVAPQGGGMPPPPS